MNKSTFECIARVQSLGISWDDAWAFRRISMTLHRWHELECGTEDGCIERDEVTGKTYWLNSYNGHRSTIADRETGAKKRLEALMSKYAPLSAYIQGDPRGASVFILRPGDVAEGFEPADAYWRGVAVYK